MTAIVAGMVLVFVGLLGLGLLVPGARASDMLLRDRWPLADVGRAVFTLAVSATLLCSGVALLVGGG